MPKKYCTESKNFELNGLRRSTRVRPASRRHDTGLRARSQRTIYIFIIMLGPALKLPRSWLEGLRE